MQCVHNAWTKASGDQGKSVGFSNPCFLCEQDSSDRNHALAYMCKEEGVFPQQNHPPEEDQTSTHGCKAIAGFNQEDLEQVLQLFSMLESITIDTEKMAVIAATLANGGVCPLTNERVFSEKVTRNCLSTMAATGALLCCC